MAHQRLPLVGDPVDAGRLRIPAGIGADLAQCLRQFDRQALHATRLELQHPQTGELVAWEVPLPDDFQNLLSLLRADQDADSGN
eukprot:UN18234